METLKISDGHFRRLKILCKEYYVVRGEKPEDPGKVVERLIDDDYRNYDPPEYQTTGFDRQ